jgi:hypothetical protein
MEIRMDRKMIDMDDKELHEQTPTGEKNLMGQEITQEGAVLTLGKVAINALVAVYQDEANLSGEDKVKRWELALRIKGAKNGLELTVEEIALIKKLIAKAYGPIICGPAWIYLENKQ